MTFVSGTNSYTYAWDTSSGTLTSGNYVATVSGTDLIGNAYAGTDSITFTVDTSTPTVSITTNDPDNTIKPGDNITVTVTFNEAMASSPTITIGSAVSNAALTATSSTTFTYSWSTSGVSGGSYTVTVTGTDLAGNTYAGSDSIEITLDGTAPTVTLGDTDDDNLLAASDTVTITASFNEAMTATPTISISGTSISNQLMTKLIGGSSGSFTQLGGDIDGEAADDRSGASVSLSSDGTRVAIGAYSNDGTSGNTNDNRGHVRIYDYNGSAWVQVGGDIDGEAAGDSSGYSVSLSSDGSRVAIGAIGNDGNGLSSGHVRIYDYNGSAWVQVGGDIDGEAAGDGTGHSVNLSSDGSRVAIGAPYNDGNGGSSGHVRIFNYNGSAWVQVGGDIDGEASGNYSGYNQVSLSSNGSVVAIGAYANDDNGFWSGHVRIFNYNGSAWVQVGADIDGEATNDQSGWSVSLSSNGSRVAIGATDNDGNGDNSGHVRVYDYNGTAWVQVGGDIDGEAAGDESGYSVSLSSDGSRVAIGARLNDGIGNFSATPANTNNIGHVRIYEYKVISGTGSWTQIGGDIDGEAGGDGLGVYPVSLSSDGKRVAIGATRNDGNGGSSGHVRVYEFIDESYQYVWDVDSGGAPSDGTYTVTVTGTDLAGNAYSGSESITFTLDTTAPTVTLTDTDSDNLVSTSEVVTITAGFSKTMTPTPTISITGIVTNVTMGLVDYTVTDPVVFNVTVANSGGNKYFIDGQSQLSLVLVPGQTYRFDQSDSSNAGHPISFSTTDDGTHNSGSAYTTNVTSVGTPGQSGAYTLITIPGNGPSKLYYYCTNHSSMGGDINKGIGYYYRWDTSSGTLTTGNYAATVSGTDLIGNAYLAGTQSITFTVDTISPTLTITTPSGPKVSNSSIVVTLTYSEAVTGLTTDTSKFSEATNVASLTLLSASSDGRTYTLRITPQAEGLVKLTHSPGSPPVQDLAGNSIASTVSCSFTYDTLGPTVTFSDTDDDNFLAASDTVTITANFSEGMTASPTISITGVVTNVAMSGGGTASFTASDIATSAEGPKSVYAADMDGDGDMDIVSASTEDDTIAWYENNGAADPSWTAADIATSADGAYSVFAADMDGDGDMDIVSASQHDDTIAWYENNGASDPSWTKAVIATSADSARSVFAADMDGDGDMDIVSASWLDDTIAWYENNGAADPSWTAADIATNADGAWSVYAADMDGDGDMDIISASYNDDTIAWYENNGAADPTWTASDIATSADGARSVFAADMDGDGDMDIISASINDDTIAWYENNGAADPTWTASDIATSADGARSVFAADMDGDGDMDIVSASANDNTIAWYENNGAAGPSWTKAVIATSAEWARHVFAADMDGDGDMDIVSASYSDNTIAWYENGIGYSYSWDVDSGGAPSDGTYTVTVTGTDLAGNAYSGTDSITFTLDTSAPTATLTSTDSDNLVSASEVVTITAGFSEAMTATPTISITGIVTNVIMTPVSGTNSYTYAWDTSSGTLSEGTYTATVSGTDLIGNAYAGTDSITFTVDTSTPTVSITTNDPDNTIKPGDNITVTVTFNEAMASSPTITIGSAVSNAALTATSSTTFTYSWSTSGVSGGSYTVTVTGTDLAGNTYAGSDKITITLDGTAPTVTLSDTDDDNFLAASDTVTITAAFDEAMTATPTISISGTSISNQVMSLITAASSTGSFTQLGGDIDGPSYNNNVPGNSGWSVSMSSDGTRVAIGAPYFDKPNSSGDDGLVRIYELQSNNSWSQLGQDIIGVEYRDYNGHSVSLSADGTRVAIGAYGHNKNGGTDAGHVRIYQYTPSGASSWTLYGDIEGHGASDYSGYSVSLSDDGTRVAIGAKYNDANNSQTDNRGHVRIYQNTSGSMWTKLGQDIEGDSAGDESGYSVSLSSDGSRVAIGAPKNNGNGNQSGHVRIYEYSNNSWTQLGADIDGEAANDNSGWSVSLSSDGSRVAIGAIYNKGNGNTSAGHVRIYELQSNNSWSKLGQDIDGEGGGFGFSVSLSSNGSRVAIGAYSYGGNGVANNAGQVRIYDYVGSSWVKVGIDINGEAAEDKSGYSVSLTSDGSKIAIGAPYNKGAFNRVQGHTRIYSLPVDSYKYTWDVDSGGAPSDGTYTVTVTGTDLAGNTYAGTESITFTLDATAPTVTLTDTDSDNLVSVSEVVTITAGFSEAMTATPTISITGIVTSVIMTPVSGTNSYTYAWDTSSGTLSEGTYTATVSGTDLIGNAYAGTDSITFTVDTSTPTVSITTNDPDNTIKPGDNITVTVTFNEPMASGPRITIGSAVNNAALTATSSTTFTYSWSTSGVSGGSYTVTVTGTDLAGNTYAGSDKITITLDSTAPTVTLSDTDDDNFLATSDTVTITASFSEAMTSTPTISITGVVTNVAMIKSGLVSASWTGIDIDTNANNNNIFGVWSIYSADIDGDGNMDVLSASPNRNLISWHRNDNGDGSSWTYDQIYTGSSNARFVSAADLDGDGDIDALSGGNTSEDPFAWHENTGSYISNSNWGTVEPTTNLENTWSVIATDVDGDGKLDIVVAHNTDNTIAWYKNNGAADPSFSGPNIVSSNANNVLSVYAADIDGDGDMDIVSGNYSNDTIAWYKNNGNGSGWTADNIATNADGVRFVYVADMDEDGDMDVLSASSLDNTIAWYENSNGDGASWNKNNIATNINNTHTVYAADMDGDGDKDIVTADPTNQKIILINNEGNANSWTTYDIATNIYSVYSVFPADIDGDGDKDIVAARFNAHAITWYENPGISYTFNWDVDSGGAPSDGNYKATVAGADLAGNAYSGTDSITFTLDTSAPTVTLTDTDSDNLVSTSEVVTITAGFSEAMTATPTISITGIVTSVIMTPVSGTNSYTYAWDTSSGTLSEGTYTATVSGTDLIGNAYAGTDSITFTVDTSTPTVSITTNDPDNTIKPGDNITVTVTFNEPMASGPRITIGSAVNNVALTATSSTTFTYSWNTSGVSAGSYTVTVTGTDLAGNTYAGSDSIEITLDSTPPTVTFSDTDDDNLLAASDTVTITASFNEGMTATPTISISGTSISNQLMTKLIGGSSGSFTQLGDDIDGEAAGDYTGTQVSLSSDGTRVAISATLKDSNGTDSGQVRIFELQSNNSWSQLGQNIDGDPGDNNGSSVSLSSDGSIVAIGAFSADGGGGSSGSVRIYELQSNNSWSQLGSDINGERVDDRSGASVSLSSDGSRVAIGARYNDDYGNNSGHVRIYEFQSNNSWSQLGSDINGETANDESGFSVSLSSDGSRVAIGAPYNDANGSNSGHVRVYEYSGSSWTKLGSDIDGDAAGDASGWSVSLSSDGSRVAIGAPYGDNSNFGYVRIYEFQSNNSWSQLGQDIDGEAGNDTSGYSVSLSSDGSIVAIGAPENDGNGNRSGHVRIYEFQSNNSWSQLGPDIDGEAAGDVSGRSVSLSSDGSRVAISAVGNDGNGTDSGHVRVYSVKGETYQYAWDVDSGGAPSDGTYRATVAGADLAGNVYSGTDSITFTLDTSAPTVTLTDTVTDTNNVISTTLSPTNTVTITASFSKPMTATPTIYITGVVTNVAMTRISGTNSYTYNWNTSTPTLAAGAYSVTVSGTDAIGNAYAGTDSITFTISPTFYLDANGVTVKCSGCSPGDQGVVNGVIYTAHDNTTLAAKNKNDNDWDRVVTTLVTDMSDLFRSVNNWNKNISSWDTSNVTDMSYMFYQNNFNQDIGNWDVSNVEDMKYMFHSGVFNQDIGSWDTSSVTDMSLMFAYNDEFNQDIGSWDTSKVTTMRMMLRDMDKFNQNLNSWDVSNVTDMINLFRGSEVFNGNISSWDTSKVTDMTGMFANTPFNQDISNWNTSNVTSMNSMFQSATAFNQDIGNWNTSNVTDMGDMFNTAVHLTKMSLGGVCLILDLNPVTLNLTPMQLGETMLTNNLNGEPALRHRLL